MIGQTHGTLRGACLRAATIALLGLILYIPWLGVGGLAYTEGHRTIPAHELLDASSREPGVGGRSWWVTTMFDRPYLRKTPGTPWAIAASTWACDQLPEALRPGPELPARLPGALATIGAALMVFWIARHAFPTRGDIAAFYAGVLHLLLPVFWEGARTAEIEGLHTGLTAAGSALLLWVLVGARPGPVRTGMGALAGVLILGAILAKGPAGVPVFVAAYAGGWLAKRGLARRAIPSDAPSGSRNAGAWLAALIPIAGAAAYAVWMMRVVAGLAEPPVLQSPTEFMWSADRAGRIAALVPTGLLYGLPAALALGLPWGRAAIDEAASSASAARASALGRASAWTILLALLIYAAFGVHNPRYAIPALGPIALVVGYVAHGYASGVFGPRRRRLAWHAGARWWGVWPIVLSLGMVGYIALYEQPRRGTSGREPSGPLASAIAAWSDGHPVRVHADEMIEARPELLWYAVREVNARGGAARGRWTHADNLAEALSGGSLALLRTDADSNELARLTQATGIATRTLHEGRVHRYTFALVVIEPHPSNSIPPSP